MFCGTLICVVVSAPPRSGVTLPSARAFSTAPRIAPDARRSREPVEHHRRAEHRGDGFAMPLPAMSGADPWTGSNSDGARR